MMNNNKQRTVLAVAAAWFVQPSYADTFSSTWTSNLIGPHSGSTIFEQSLHAQLKHQVYGNDRDLKEDEQTFIGPGVMECSNAVCTFEVDENLGCADPCHTQSAPDMYEYPLYTFSTVGDPYFADPSEEEPCYYRNASNINTWAPELAPIEEGCTARCTGCTFASPIVSVSGPSRLQCNDGRCTKYVHGETFECGSAIEAASDAYGSLATLPDGEHIPHEFHGFEGINGSFEIPATCNLECTGCTSHPIDSGTKTTPPTENSSTTSATTGTESTTSSTTETASASTTSQPETTTATGTDFTSTESTSPTTTETTSTSTSTTSAEPDNTTSSETGTDFTSPTGTQITSSTGTEVTSPATGLSAKSRFDQTSDGDNYLRGGTRRGKAKR
mmetsp:Transcript_10030/g.15030  ORF Transcript_10030/g.15030 Transcript_10030/m.15030 type:complete len:387 (-) Transcript_10030:106-1266(-)